MRTTRTTVGLTLTALAVLGAGGCTHDTTGKPSGPPTGTSTPSAAPTPSVDPNDPQAVAYATATQLFEDYFTLSQQIRQKPGVPDWESVLDYTSGDVRTNNIALYNSMLARGGVQQGEARIVSDVPTSYKEDPEATVVRADVILTVCMDSSGSGDMPGWLGGPSKSKPGEPDRVLLTYTVRAFLQQDGELFWAIDSAEILEGQGC